jgi:hypothetical protein
VTSLEWGRTVMRVYLSEDRMKAEWANRRTGEWANGPVGATDERVCAAFHSTRV